MARHRYGPYRTPDMTDEQCQILFDMAHTPETQVAIAKTLDVPRSRVRFWMRELNLPVLSRTDGFQIGARNQRNRHKVHSPQGDLELHSRRIGRQVVVNRSGPVTWFSWTQGSP